MTGGELSWPGYSPWATTVAASRREFVRVARSFWLIPELIPPRARDDLALLYCACRQLDDAVDEAATPEEARAALAQFRDELGGRRPARPLIAALRAGAAEGRRPLHGAEFLLDGIESDLGVVRFTDDEALLRYAYRVSSAVGLMVAPLLGAHGSEVEQRIVDLGLALQLSNILLGVEGDARRGRVYLPGARLAAVHLTAADVLRAPSDPRLLPVLQGLAALADRYYRSAELGAALVPLRYRHGILLLARVYGELGWRAARGGSSASSPLVTKAQSLLALALSAWHPRTLGLIPPPPHDPALHRAIAGWPGTDALAPREVAPPHRRERWPLVCCRVGAAEHDLEKER